MLLLLLLLGGVHAYSSSPNDDSRPGECTYIRGGGAKREEKQREGSEGRNMISTRQREKNMI